MARRRVRLGLAVLAGLSVVAVAGAHGEPRAPVASRLQMCAACHGPEGLSRAQMFPNLTYQQQDYLVVQLTEFRARTRKDRDARSYMWGMAKGLSDADIQFIAAYYATRPPGVVREKGTSPALAEGKAIYEQGAAHGVLACTSCHGAGGEGNAIIPRLAGQKQEYLVVQLHAFASGSRANAQMSLVAKAMTAAEIKSVASYMASR